MFLNMILPTIDDTVHDHSSTALCSVPYVFVKWKKTCECVSPLPLTFLVTERSQTHSLCIHFTCISDTEHKPLHLVVMLRVLMRNGLCSTRTRATRCRYLQYTVMCDVVCCVITAISLLHILVLGSYRGNLDLVLAFEERSSAVCFPSTDCFDSTSPW